MESRRIRQEQDCAYAESERRDRERAEQIRKEEEQAQV